MHQSKAMSTPLGQQFKLSKTQSPNTDSEKVQMDKVPYANDVGSIMYEMVCSRSDLAYVVSLVSRFMANPGRSHWDALKWTMRYLCSPTDLGLMFEKAAEVENLFQGFVDSDFAGNIDTRKSLSGYVFTLYGTTISWRAVLQSVVALSTTEA